MQNKKDININLLSQEEMYEFIYENLYNDLHDRLLKDFEDISRKIIISLIKKLNKKV